MEEKFFAKIIRKCRKKIDKNSIRTFCLALSWAVFIMLFLPTYQNYDKAFVSKTRACQ